MKDYIFGLMATDGFMDKYEGQDHNTYYAKLELTDEQIIKDIADYFNISYKHRMRIIKDKERHFYSLVIPKNFFKGVEEVFRCNRDGLFDLYMVSNKSDFIRGMFDGDGSVCSFNKGLRITGVINGKHTDILKIWEDFANENGLYLYKYFDKRGSGSYNISFNKKDSVNFIYNFMYSNNPKLFLKRKYNVFVKYGFPDLVTSQ